MKNQISVGNISKTILKNILVIIICGVVVGLVAGLYAKHKQTTTYAAKTNMVIGHNLNKVNYRNSTVAADINMMDTYEDQIKDPQVINEAHSKLPKKLRKKYSAKAIESDISTENEEHSLVMTIKATTRKPKDSVIIANTVAKSFKNQFSNMNPTSAEVKLLAPAKESNVVSKTKPSAKKYTVAGFALGILIGMLIAFGWTSLKKIA